MLILQTQKGVCITNIEKLSSTLKHTWIAVHLRLFDRKAGSLKKTPSNMAKNDTFHTIA